MFKRLIKNHPRLAGLIIAIVIVALIPLFVSSPYYLDLFIMVIVNAVLAMTFIMTLRTGLINLGIAAFWGVGAYTSTMLVTELDLSFWLSLPVSALVTAVIALCLGYALVKSAGFTFVIITALLGMLFVVAVGNASFLGGYNGISNIPPPNPISIPFLPTIEFVSKIHYFYLVLFLSAVVILIISAFNAGWIGRAWTAIGLKPQLAETLGISVFRYRLLSFVVASAIAGLIGSFTAHYQGFVQPNTYGLFSTIYIHVYAILGGIGYAILGPVVGSTVMIFFPEMIRMTREYGPIFFGALLVLLIIFLPQGLISLVAPRSMVRGRIANIGKAIKSWLLSRRRTMKA